MTNETLVSTYLCMTKDIGLGGNLFGGVIMSWLDEAGAIFAYKHTGAARLVTVKYTEIVFALPVKVGDIVTFYANNPRPGRTSITFDLEGRVDGGVVCHTTATFVAVDEHGKPTPLP